MLTRKETAVLLACILALQMPFVSYANMQQPAELFEQVYEEDSAAVVAVAVEDETLETDRNGDETEEIQTQQLAKSENAEAVFFKPGNTWMDGLDFDKSKVKDVWESTETETDLLAKGCRKLGTVDVQGSVWAYYYPVTDILYLCMPKGKRMCFNEDSSSMFEGFSSLRRIPGFPVKSVEKADRMFKGCTSLTSSVPLRSFSAVETCDEMFSGCAGIQVISFAGISAEHMKSYKDMFAGCTGIVYVVTGDNFIMGAALPEELMYYNGWDDEGRCGYKNTEIPEKFASAYVTDLTQGCLIAYCRGGKSNTYDYCDYFDGTYAVGSCFGQNPRNKVWKDRESGAVYLWGEKIDFNSLSELTVAWRTLDEAEDKESHVYSFAEIPPQNKNCQQASWEMLREYFRIDGKKVDIYSVGYIGRYDVKDNGDGTGVISVTVDGQEITGTFQIREYAGSDISFNKSEIKIRLRGNGSMTNYQRAVKLRSNYTRADVLRAESPRVSVGQSIHYYVEDETVIQLLPVGGSIENNEWILMPLKEGSTTVHAVVLKAGYGASDMENPMAWESESSCKVTVFADTVEKLVKSLVTFEVGDHGTAPAPQKVIEGKKIPKPADPSASPYSFGGWYRETACTNAWDFEKDLMPREDIILYAKWTYTGGGSDGGSSGGSGGGGSSGGGSSGGGSAGGGGGGGAAGGPSAKKTASGTPTFSKNWTADAAGVWRIKDKAGNYVTSAWLCDDAVAANGQNVWYLMNTDGTMLAAGLVQDNTGNYYSLETNHNGYYGMLRYKNGTYDGIYMEFSQKHDGTFGAITNQSAIDALKAKYGVTKFGIGNDRCVYTKTFE